MSKSTALSAEDKIQMARTQVVLRHPFFATLMLRMTMNENHGVETMQTDGKTVEYNPAWIDTLTEPQLRGAMAHECMHVAMGHHARRRNREDEIWQRATDFAINPVIKEAGLELPPGYLLDAKYHGMSADEIYEILMRNPPPPKPKSGGRGKSGGGQPDPNGEPGDGGGGQDGGQPDPNGEPGDGGGGQDGGHDPGNCGAVGDAKGKDGKQATQAEMKEAEQEAKLALCQAAQVAKMAGKLPASMERYVQDMLEPKPDLYTLLRDFMDRAAKNDYSWARPNRRFAHQGYYLPQIGGVGMGEMIVAVDTSGSIDNNTLKMFAGVLNKVVEEVKPERIHVVYCDAAVNRVEMYEQDQEIELRGCGGGGTDFRPPFAWAERYGIEPACMVYLTDLCCSSYPEKPGFPVLWGVYGGISGYDKAPFGEVIMLDRV